MGVTANSGEPEFVLLLQTNSKRDGRKYKDQRDHNRDSVEVSFDDGRTSRSRIQTATEHVGKPATPPAVKQNQEDKHSG
jgi:hypothetical protein